MEQSYKEVPVSRGYIQRTDAAGQNKADTEFSDDNCQNNCICLPGNKSLIYIYSARYILSSAIEEVCLPRMITVDWLTALANCRPVRSKFSWVLLIAKVD